MERWRQSPKAVDGDRGRKGGGPHQNLGSTQPIHRLFRARPQQSGIKAPGTPHGIVGVLGATGLGPRTTAGSGPLPLGACSQVPRIKSSPKPSSARKPSRFLAEATPSLRVRVGRTWDALRMAARLRAICTLLTHLFNEAMRERLLLTPLNR